MAQFRVETVFDHSNGLFFVELYYPNDSTTPIARTGSIYPTHETAIADAVSMLKEGLPKASRKS